MVLLGGCTTNRSPDNVEISQPGGGSVLRVIDGDTLDIDLGGTTTRVRLIGINAPESVDPNRPQECFGPEASQHLHELLPPGTSVRIERDKELVDKFGRTLGYVFRSTDDVMINWLQAVDGYAIPLSIAPNTTHEALFRSAAYDAKAQGRGLWSACPATRDASHP